MSVETDVLIVGSGRAGSTVAALLSSYGIDNIVVTRYRWTANTPRAHITNQGALEVFRDLGIEPEVMREATHQHLMGNNVFCESLAGEELGRLRTWGTHPSRMADYTLASPTRMCDIPQDLLEPLGMLGAPGPRADAGQHAGPQGGDARGRRAAGQAAGGDRVKNYESNAHGVELNQGYRSSAVVGDGTPPPAFERDPELYHQATTWPGARLPHCWVDVGGREGPPATWRATGALRS